MYLKCFNYLLLALTLAQFGFTFKQVAAVEIVLGDKKHENETFYYDLAYLNSDFSQNEEIGLKERSGKYKAGHSCNNVRKIPANVRYELKLSYFYQKYTEAYGIPVIGSNKASMSSMKRACYVLRFYLSNSDALKEAFYKKNIRLVLVALSENILKLPEYESLPSSWDKLKGLSATKQIPLITVAEEALLCGNNHELDQTDHLFHQFSYTSLSINALNSNQEYKLNTAFHKAKSVVPWKNTFHLSDKKEYLASAIDVYFNASKNKQFNVEELKLHDKPLFELIKQLFTCNYEYLNKCESNRESEASQELSATNCKTNYQEKYSILRAKTLPMETITSKATASTTTAMSTSSPRSTTLTRSTARTRPITSTAQIEDTKKPTRKIIIFSRASTQSTSIETSASTQSTTIVSSRESLCENLNKNCENWASKDQCNRNRQFMHVECKRSCGLCEASQQTMTTTLLTSTTSHLDLSVFLELCKDEFAHCPVFALRGDCKSNPHHMLDKCKRSCNLCGDLVEQKDRIRFTSKKNASKKTHQYTITTTTTTTTQSEEENKCIDLAPHCAELALRGDCAQNKETMKYYCSKSCDFC